MVFNEFLELDYSTNDKKMINDSWDLIAKECSQQPHVLCHFDFEFRNLMLLEKNEIGILDFQDLCLGPYAIDLVSILKDIENPLSHEDLLNYLQFYIDGNKSNKLDKLKLSDVEKDLDFAGFQRQFRILGTLSRLHLRDKKSFRLKDLKQTLKFLQEDLEKYAPLKELATFLTEKVELETYQNFKRYLMKAFLLAAGKGKRLLPFTKDNQSHWLKLEEFL